MGCQLTHLLRSQGAADGQHLSHRIASSHARPPRVQLRFDIGWRLPGKRRVCGAHPFPAWTMAACTFRRIEGRYRGQRFARRRQAGIVSCYQRAVFAIQPPDYAPHLSMFASAVGIVVHLSVEIAGVEPGQPGRKPSVAFSAKPVTSGAGMAGPSVTATKGDDLAAFPKSAVATGSAAAGKREGNSRKQAKHPPRNRSSGCRFHWQRTKAEWGYVSS